MTSPNDLDVKIFGDGADPPGMLGMS